MMKRFFILFFAVFLTQTSQAETKVPFINGSLITAKEKAGAEGKLYFVDFVASWCMPCRWMDETTFSDPRLANYVTNNYVAVKVDIDDFDGIVWKNKYNIRTLPSILIFNSKGELLERIEESLAPSKMISILQKHDKPSNRIVTGSFSRPKLDNNPTPPVRPAPKPKLPSTQPNNTNTNSSTATVGTGEGLYRFTVARQSSKGFSVQVGAYGQYENVLREVSKLQNEFSEPIIVHIAKLRDKTVYKIMIGAFSSRTSADKYKSKMKNKGVQGIIKDLSTM